MLAAAVGAVCREYGIEEDQLLSRSKMRWVVDGRRLLIGVLRLAGWSYPQIGQALGLDHTTVLHSYRTSGVDCLDRAERIYDELTQDSSWMLMFNKSLGGDDVVGDMCWLVNGVSGEQYELPRGLEEKLVLFIRGLE